MVAADLIQTKGVELVTKISGPNAQTFAPNHRWPEFEVTAIPAVIAGIGKIGS
jgi:hypothetical protein